MSDLQENKNTMDNLIIAALIAIAILALLFCCFWYIKWLIVKKIKNKIIEKGTNVITKIVQNSLDKKQ